MSAPGNVRSAEGGRDTWETPALLFDKLDAEFRFTLDAAAGEANRKCERWLEGPCVERPCPLSADGCCNTDGYVCRGGCGNRGTMPCSCGLHADVFDHVVWCNPPYGDGLMDWVKRFAYWAWFGGCTVVALLPASTDVAWFRYVFQSASEIRLLYRRVQFVGTTSSNPSGSIVAVWRPGQSYRRIQPSTPHVSLWDWKADL